MKQIIQLIFIGILSLTIFISCEKDAEPIPELVNLVPVAKVWALPESIPYAGTTTIYWNTSNVASATVNNISIPTNGSCLLEGLVSDTTFTFKFISSGKKTEIDTVVTVKVAKPTIYDTISSLYWVFQVSKGLINGKWESFYFDEDMRTRKWFLYKDKTYEEFKKDGSRIGEGTYEIRKDTLELNNDNYCKFKLSLIDSTLMLYNMDSTVVTFYKGF